MTLLAAQETCTQAPFEVYERSTPQLYARFTYPDPADPCNPDARLPIPSTALDDVRLTVFEVVTESIINFRDEQDVLGPAKTGINNVTIDANGNLVWFVQRNDTDILFPDDFVNIYRARFTWNWNPQDGQGLRQHYLLFDMHVINLQRIPPP